MSNAPITYTHEPHVPIACDLMSILQTVIDLRSAKHLSFNMFFQVLRLVGNHLAALLGCVNLTLVLYTLQLGCVRATNIDAKSESRQRQTHLLMYYLYFTHINIYISLSIFRRLCLKSKLLFPISYQRGPNLCAWIAAIYWQIILRNKGNIHKLKSCTYNYYQCLMNICFTSQIMYLLNMFS